MSESQVSIERMKHEISELLNRVAYGGERIVLTSRGKPKAVIVSVDDYEQIRRAGTQIQLNRWGNWLAANEALTAKILAERGGEPLDVDAILIETRSDLDERHDYFFEN